MHKGAVVSGSAGCFLFLLDFSYRALLAPRPTCQVQVKDFCPEQRDLSRVVNLMIDIKKEVSSKAEEVKQAVASCIIGFAQTILWIYQNLGCVLYQRLSDVCRPNPQGRGRGRRRERSSSSSSSTRSAVRAARALAGSLRG